VTERVPAGRCIPMNLVPTMIGWEAWGVGGPERVCQHSDAGPVHLEERLRDGAELVPDRGLKNTRRAGNEKVELCD